MALTLQTLKVWRHPAAPTRAARRLGAVERVLAAAGLPLAAEQSQGERHVQALGQLQELRRAAGRLQAICQLQAAGRRCMAQ
jgi:hypothetical protein